MINLNKNSDNLAEQLRDILREDLFTVDGFVGTIPCYVTPGVMLEYNRQRMNRGDDVAATWAMELLLGQEGMVQLIGAQVSDEQLDQIISVIIGRVRGATRGEPGKGGAAAASKPDSSVKDGSTDTLKSA